MAMQKWNGKGTHKALPDQLERYPLDCQLQAGRKAVSDLVSKQWLLHAREL